MARAALGAGAFFLTDSGPAGRYLSRVIAVSTPVGLTGGVAAVVEPAAPLTFQEVYDGNVDYVWKTVCRLGVHGPAVEDAVQEVFVVVHRKLASFEGRSSMHTWLFQIARRVVHDHRRTVRRKERPPGPNQSVPDLGAVAADESTSPDAAARRAEAARVLYKLLDNLDTDKREVFILAELDQLAAPKIADVLGINVNTVYSRLRLAREAFNAALARHHARDGKT
jgi:RNA polymerase sigma-70 factor (ECF subfamily)